MKIGLNTDAHSWFLEDLNKYEWDGPKVQYDTNQLIDFYDKIINEHPLVEYLEDCFQINDIQSYKKVMRKGNVKVGVNKLFKSDLEIIKHYTQLITKEKSEEDEEKVHDISPPVEKVEETKTLNEAPSVMSKDSKL